MRYTINSLLVLLALSSPSYASSVYVSTAGSDGNSCLSTTTPCKTITHAWAIANVGDTIIPAGGTYFENVKISKSGTDPHHIIRLIPVSGTVVYVDGSQGVTGSNSLDITASYILIDGLHVLNGKNDGAYVHGTDAAHPAVGVRLSLSGFYNNANHNVEALYTTDFDLGYGRIFGSGKSGVLLTQSPFWKVHDQNIYQSGTPIAAGMVAVNSPNGNYEGNNGKENLNSVNLDLESSPFTFITGNAPGTGGTFTCIINPRSDIQTDTISDNGTSTCGQ